MHRICRTADRYRAKFETRIHLLTCRCSGLTVQKEKVKVELYDPKDETIPISL